MSSVLRAGTHMWPVKGNVLTFDPVVQMEENLSAHFTDLNHLYTCFSRTPLVCVSATDVCGEREKQTQLTFTNSFCVTFKRLRATLTLACRNFCFCSSPSLRVQRRQHNKIGKERLTVIQVED